MTLLNILLSKCWGCMDVELSYAHICKVWMFCNSNFPNLSNQHPPEPKTTANRIPIIAPCPFCSDPLDIYTTKYQHLLGLGDLIFDPSMKDDALFCPLTFTHASPGIFFLTSFPIPLLSEYLLYRAWLFAHVWEDRFTFGPCVSTTTFFKSCHVLLLLYSIQLAILYTRIYF